MTIKILASNCKIINLPLGWEAIIDGNGKCIISVPDYLSVMFGEDAFVVGKPTDINGLTLVPFDNKPGALVLYRENMDNTNFYKFDGIPQEVAVVSVLREEPEVKDEKEKKVERNDF